MSAILFLSGCGGTDNNDNSNEILDATESAVANTQDDDISCSCATEEGAANSLQSNVGSSADAQNQSGSLAGAAQAIQTANATPTLPTIPYNYANITLPQHYLTNAFPEAFTHQNAAQDNDNQTVGNTVTDAGAALGRVLFYDKKISANGTIACASCHKQSLGFADNKKHSVGHAGGKTRRHSMSLTNARFYKSGKFFWDERASSLEQQVLLPIKDKVETGLTLDEAVTIVEGQSYYAPLFTAAFGDNSVTQERMSKALAQFVRSMVSYQSRYDLARAEVSSPLEAFPAFTDQENLGKQLFMGDGAKPSCVSCHVSEAFVSRSTGTTNNGMDAESTDDLGVYETTKNLQDTGKFKVPSLRNIEVSAPYKHDGRFATLEEVIEHYSSGIQPHPQLDSVLRDETTGDPVNFNFTEEQKAAVVAFLKTLTDQAFLTDEKFSDPF